MFDWFLHPPAKVEPFRPAITSLMIWADINLALTAVFLVFTPDPLEFNLWLGLSALLVAGYVRFFIPYTVKDGVEGGEFVEEGAPERLFCKDCGQKFVMRQRQEGFDSVTGRPNLSYQLGCPSGDPAKTTRAYERYANGLKYGGGLSLFRGQRYTWPNCDDPKIVGLQPVGHLSHDPGETSVECPKCIEQMLVDGIIDVPAAKMLIGAIGSVE